MSGYVYCLSVDADPTVVKIGATTREAKPRASACARRTRAPGRFWRFELVAAVEVADVWATERALHALLAAERAQAQRARVRYRR